LRNRFAAVAGFEGVEAGQIFGMSAFYWPHAVRMNAKPKQFSWEE
jgi:hypothetical protein